MKDKDDKPLDGQMDYVSFEQIVQEVTGAKLSDIYNEYLTKGARDESDMV